jgi:hypothetical protein
VRADQCFEILNRRDRKFDASHALQLIERDRLTLVDPGMRRLLSVAISSDAIAGFAGVVTGAVITGGFQFALAWRSDRRHARTTRRLIRAELSDLMARMIFCAQRQMWEDIVENSEAPVWHKHREDFAESSPESAWSAVDGAYRDYLGQMHRIAVDIKRPPGTAATSEERLGWVSYTVGTMCHGLRALGDDSVGDEKVELGFVEPSGPVII